MKVTVKMTGGPAFVGQFKLLDLAAADRIGKQIERSTGRVESGAKARVPSDTGELAGTIRSTYSEEKLRGLVMVGRGELPRKGAPGKRTKSGAVAKLGKGAYAAVVEFGSQNPVRQPKPFLFPSAEAERPALTAGLVAALKGAVRDVEGAA